MSNPFKGYLLIAGIAVGGAIAILFPTLGVPAIPSSLSALIPIALVAIKDAMDKRKEDVKDAEAKLTDERVNHIDEVVTKSNVELEYKNNVMKEFLKNGIVQEDDIIENLNQQTFTIFYHFNRSIDDRLLPYLPGNKKAVKEVLESLGFIPVGAFYGSYFFHIISTDALPKPLNDISYLEAYIRKKVRGNWSKMWSNLKKSDEKLYKEFEDRKNKEVNLVYLLGKVFPSNLSIGYINFSSFDRQFLAYYSRFIDMKKIKIDYQKLSSLLSLASLNLLVSSIEPKDREIIISNETKIKQELGVKSFLDYQSVKEDRWTFVLNKIFNDIPRSEKYSHLIVNATSHYCPIIREFS